MNDINNLQTPQRPDEKPADREFDLAIRRARLLEIDAIERRHGISPRTAELRRMQRDEPKETKE